MQMMAAHPLHSSSSSHLVTPTPSVTTMHRGTAATPSCSSPTADASRVSRRLSTTLSVHASPSPRRAASATSTSSTTCVPVLRARSATTSVSASSQTTATSSRAHAAAVRPTATASTSSRTRSAPSASATAWSPSFASSSPPSCTSVTSSSQRTLACTRARSS